MSIFNPADFMNVTIEEANSTQRLLVPEGEYLAVVEKVECRPWTSKADPTKSGVTLEITWSIQDPNILAQMDLPSVKLRQGVMLDFNDNGALDMGKGKNVGLGRLRAALDLNKPGVVFRFPDIVGKLAKVMVKHEVDKNDPEKVYDRVVAAAPNA